MDDLLSLEARLCLTAVFLFRRWNTKAFFALSHSIQIHEAILSDGRGGARP